MEQTDLRSRQMTPDRTAHRAAVFPGLTQEDFEKPMIAVVNSWNEIAPGCKHFAPVIRAGQGRRTGRGRRAV